MWSKACNLSHRTGFIFFHFLSRFLCETNMMFTKFFICRIRRNYWCWPTMLSLSNSLFGCQHCVGRWTFHITLWSPNPGLEAWVAFHLHFFSQSQMCWCIMYMFYCSLCLTLVKNEDKMELTKILEAIKV